MNKNSIIAMLVVLVVLMAITLMVVSYRGGGQGGIQIEDDKTVEKVRGEAAGAKGSKGWKGASGLTGGDVDRLPDRRVVTNSFIMTGKGNYSKWGRGLNAAFRLTGEFVADAKIVKRDKLGNRRFKVVEDRTFLVARETLEITDADYFLALDTLPLDEISTGLDSAGKAAETLGNVLVSTGIPKLAAAGAIAGKSGDVAELIASGLRHFKVKNNGKSLRDFGIDLSSSASNKVVSVLNDLSRTPPEIETMIRSVEGRTYRFTYINDDAEKPVNITAERLVDGKTSPLETEEEVWILTRCNAFIDANFLEDGGSKNPQPGDKWSIDARFLASLVGMDGYCAGRLSCYRDADEATSNGLMWKIKINPTELDVKDDGGRGLGKISVGGGEATIRDADKTLQDFVVKGSGKLNRVNKNSMLFLPFNQRFFGDCTFVGKMSTKIVK